ncbi:hypothetical protein IWQ61_001580 [Dispira simplex]|nr:hypothetical protein IWQ61_001580 [Dispira simplex]
MNSTTYLFGKLAGLTVALTFVLCVGVIAQSTDASPIVSDESLRIIGGETAPPGMFTFSAHIRIGGESIPTSECGGAIIAAQWVLTVAHCIVQRKSNGIPLKASQLKVGYGSNNKDQMRLVQVSEVYVHPSYKISSPAENDITLLKLSEPIPQWDASVAPIPIGSSLVMDQQKAMVMGWGLTDPKNKQSLATTLNVAQVFLSNNVHRCRQLYPQFSDSNNDRVCSLENKGTDTCQGDSGGPLVVFDAFYSRYVLVGLTSYGNSPSGQALCGAPDNIAFYTHVAYFLPFITTVTGLPIGEIVAGDGTTNMYESEKVWKSPLGINAASKVQY